MIRVCELFTDEPDGGSSMIPLKTFLNLYGYLAKLNCSSKQYIKSTDSSLKNTEITSGNLQSIKSSLFDNEKRIHSMNSISMEDLKSVCTHDETDKSICELIFDESDDYSVTTTGENKTYDDNIKCQDGLSEDEMTVNEYKPLIDDETSVKFTVMNEVTIVQDGIYDEIEKDFDNTVAEEEEEEEEEVEVDEHVMLNKNHNSPRDLEGSVITLDSLRTVNVTNEISTTEFTKETIKTNLSISVNKNKMSSSPVGGDIEIGGEGKTNVTGVNEKLVEMVNEVEEVKKERKQHIVVNTMEKQKDHMKNGRDNSSEGLRKCHEESWKIKKMNEAKTCLVELSECDEKSSCDKVTEFICKMKNTIYSSVNYDVVGIGGVVSDECITKVGLWLTECGLQQGGHVGPRNLRHFLCPSLYDVNNDDDGRGVNSSHETETN
ncbi:hypothetical protein PV326_000690 [Microctonus aethiopoides]|nr:hypothetical protein PV326_000690 [Microctonus aethiopoides]